MTRGINTKIPARHANNFPDIESLKPIDLSPYAPHTGIGDGKIHPTAG